MKAASLNVLKKEMAMLSHQQLLEMLLQVSKYKKENKELLSYLIFDAGDKDAFVKEVKSEMDDMFKEVNTYSVYYTKKDIRKLLKWVQKYIKFSGDKEMEVDFLLHFCRKMNTSGLKMRQDKVLQNIYWMQLKKVEKALSSLHDDLQYDYRQALDKLLSV